MNKLHNHYKNHLFNNQMINIVMIKEIINHKMKIKDKMKMNLYINFKCLNNKI